MPAPPVLVITAEYDPLCDEDEFYVGKLRTAGVATTLMHDDGLNHGVMFLVGVVDKAGAALSEAREWLLGTPTSATIENENTVGNRPGNRISHSQWRFLALRKRNVDTTSICESRRNPEALRINFPRVKFGFETNH